jgi:hypothetical protein
VRGEHWFDSDPLSFGTIAANDSKINFSIRGHAFLKDGRPIDIPTGEDGMRIPRDSEEDRATIDTRQTQPPCDIR